MQLQRRAFGHTAQRAEEDERQQLRPAAAERLWQHVATLLLFCRGAKQDPREKEAHAAVTQARRELRVGRCISPCGGRAEAAVRGAQVPAAAPLIIVED